MGSGTRIMMDFLLGKKVDEGEKTSFENSFDCGSCKLKILDDSLLPITKSII